MIRFNRDRIRELLVSLIILLPYLEDSTVNSVLTIRIGNASYLRPINVYMGIVIVFAIISLPFYRRKRDKYIYERSWPLVFIIILSVLSSFLQTQDFLPSFCTAIWFVEPIIYALLIADYCWRRGLERNNIIKYMCYLFGIYCVLKLYGYITNIGFGSGLRMRATGGGAVIFGYTIVVMFAMLLSIKDRVNLVVFYGILAIYSLTAVATGSRGAIWPIVFLWISSYLLNTWSNRGKIIIIVMIPLLFILMFINIPELLLGSSANIARLANFEDIYRAETYINSIKVFSQLPFFKMIFGAGLGNLFPYQYWSLLVQARAHNTFVYNNLTLLVQPHNSFLYMLIENGLIGLILLCIPIIKTTKSIIHKHSDNYKQQAVVIFCIVFVNFFDSIFFVQPGVAGNIWLFLLLLFDINKIRE